MEDLIKKYFQNIINRSRMLLGNWTSAPKSPKGDLGCSI